MVKAGGAWARPIRACGSLPDRTSSSLAGAGGTVVSSVFAAAEGAGLVACVTVLALVLRRPRRHKPEDEAHEPWRPPLPWWAKAVAVLVALAMLIAPWVVLLAGRNRGNSTQLAPPARHGRGAGRRVRRGWAG